MGEVLHAWPLVVRSHRTSVDNRAVIRAYNFFLEGRYQAYTICIHSQYRLIITYFGLLPTYADQDGTVQA